VRRRGCDHQDSARPRLPVPGRYVNSWARDSLRGALTVRLVTVFTVIGVIAGGIAYRLRQGYADLAYDRSLSDDGVTLASQIGWHNGQLVVDLPPAARTWLLANEGERVLYRVVDLRLGRVLESNADLGPWSTAQRQRSSTQFRDATIDEVPFRVGFM